MRRSACASSRAAWRSRHSRRNSEVRLSLVTGLVVGLGAGFLAGIFGVGGGILIVPALVLAAGMTQRLAHGTSLAAIVPISIAGVIGYATSDKIDWAVALLLIVGAAGIGAWLGTALLHRLPQRALALTFAAVLVVSAVRLAFDTSEATGRADLSVAGAVGFILLGVLSGTLAGLLGVGGGIVMVPVMVLFGGIPAAIAKGTSLVVIIPTGLVGTSRNVKLGNADLRVALVVGLAGVASSFAASKISVELDETTSNRLFAALLAVVAVKMLWDNRRPRPELPPTELPTFET
jgi:uncharacterized protein